MAMASGNGGELAIVNAISEIVTAAMEKSKDDNHYDNDNDRDQHDLHNIIVWMDGNSLQSKMRGSGYQGCLFVILSGPLRIIGKTS